MASFTLWMGQLAKHIIELGPSGSFAIDGQLAFTCWQTGDLLALFGKFEGKTVNISIEEIGSLSAPSSDG